MKPERARTVALASLLLTCLFFFEYLPPFRWAHIPYDLDGFHYPLLNYAFQGLGEGRFPQWDNSTYCGITLVGNIQAGLFYPPNWLLFAANIGRERLAFWTLQLLVLAHVWLGFFLCYLWLRGKHLGGSACLFGAAGFAFGGYMLVQLQHLGLICAYAWMPLGLLAIDQAVEAGHWRPLWKLSVVSALGLLAGYPPTWFVFCVSAGVYALATGKWRVVLWTAAGLAFSLALAMVQLLPALEAAGMKFRELKYGTGIRNPGFYVPYLVPNYHDFGLNAPLIRDTYLYLGAPMVFGLAWICRRRRLWQLRTDIAVLAVSIVLVSNPGNLVWQLVRHSSLLTEVCRDWYFLAGISLGLIPLAAAGIDDFLNRGRITIPRWLMFAALAAAAAWAAWELWIWRPGGLEFPSGWRSAWYPAVSFLLFGTGLCVLKACRRPSIAVFLLLIAAADYKAFGTSKQFNARYEDLDKGLLSEPFQGLDPALYTQIRSAPEYRLATDPKAQMPGLLRRDGIASPQGFDPLLPAQYSQKLEEFARPADKRTFDLDPTRVDLLRNLGVRWFLTSESGAYYSVLLGHPEFRAVPPFTSYYKLFELNDAFPAYRWNGTARILVWKPEHRELIAGSRSGGHFILAEQFYPGWRAEVDGKPAPIERYDGAFQRIRVPPGEHRVAFRYRSDAFVAGALCSTLAVAGLFFLRKSYR